eukprot:180701-Amphidinium_carterae.2
MQFILSTRYVDAGSPATVLNLSQRTAYPIKQRLVAGYDTAAPDERAQRQQRRAGATTATFSMD